MRRVLLALSTLFALLCCGDAAAHKSSDSYLTLTVRGQRVDGRWDIALRDLEHALGLDADGDGQLTWDEIRSRHRDIAAYALARLALSSSAGPCTTAAGPQQIDQHGDGAYTVLYLAATCPDAADVLEIDYRLFADLDPQHRGLVSLPASGQAGSAVFGPERPRQRLAALTPSPAATLAAYAGHGVEHILAGYDHILFLLSLLLPVLLAPAASSWRGAAGQVLLIVTAFTVAHSATLALAALQWVALPSRWVESAIAASVLLAATNIMVPLLAASGARLAFGFGLIHGFGFAAVLADLGLPRQSLLWSLLGFNLGVELGQVFIVALALPLAWLLRRSRRRRQLLNASSLAIALVAAAWLIERAFDVQLPMG